MSFIDWQTAKQIKKTWIGLLIGIIVFASIGFVVLMVQEYSDSTEEADRLEEFLTEQGYSIGYSQLAKWHNVFGYPKEDFTWSLALWLLFADNTTQIERDQYQGENTFFYFTEYGNETTVLYFKVHDYHSDVRELIGR